MARGSRAGQRCGDLETWPEWGYASGGWAHDMEKVGGLGVHVLIEPTVLGGCWLQFAHNDAQARFEFRFAEVSTSSGRVGWCAASLLPSNGAGCWGPLSSLFCDTGRPCSISPPLWKHAMVRFDGLAPYLLAERWLYVACHSGGFNKLTARSCFDAQEWIANHTEHHANMTEARPHLPPSPQMFITRA